MSKDFSARAKQYSPEMAMLNSGKVLFQAKSVQQDTNFTLYLQKLQSTMKI